MAVSLFFCKKFVSPMLTESGEPGSGKTTLLNILATVDRPTNGQVFLNDKNVTSIPESDLARFRREHLGFVFQDFNLLDTFSLEDNILLPLVLAGKKYQEMEPLLRPLASSLGISELLKKYPYEVSGEQEAGIVYRLTARAYYWIVNS